jgi:hypothetical protein
MVPPPKEDCGYFPEKPVPVYLLIHYSKDIDGVNRKEVISMSKVKRLTLDRYEHGLLVRALYEKWKRMLDEGADTTAIKDLILRVIDAPTKKRFWRV